MRVVCVEERQGKAETVQGQEGDFSRRAETGDEFKKKSRKGKEFCK